MMKDIRESLRCGFRLLQDRRGAALMEFALVTPLLLVMLLGIIGYGGYFWRAHALQQVANDAARASLAGLTATERADLVRGTIKMELGRLGGISPALANVEIEEAMDTITVRLAYDASAEAIFHLGLVPMPSATIRRSAAVRLGGL